MDFCQSFMKRHKELANRYANNMKQARATVTPEEMNQYFDNLTETLEHVPPSNIFNYDESNLSDDPGRKKVIAKKELNAVLPEHVSIAAKVVGLRLRHFLLVMYIYFDIFCLKSDSAQDNSLLFQFLI